MKKTFTFLFFSLFFSFSLFSQNNIALRGGIFFSKNYYDSEVLSDNVKGLDIGIASRLYVYKKAYIQPEISFIQKGGLLKHVIDDSKITTNQLEIAALIGYELSFKKAFIFANIGAFTGKILSESTEGNPYINFDFVKITDSEIDWGYVYGGGLGVQIGKGRLFAEYRYRLSKKFFRSIKRGTSPQSTLPNLRVKNKGWGLNLGYALPF